MDDEPIRNVWGPEAVEFEFSGLVPDWVVSNWQDYVAALEAEVDALRARLVVLTEAADALIKSAPVGYIVAPDSAFDEAFRALRAVLDSVPEGE